MMKKTGALIGAAVLTFVLFFSVSSPQADVNLMYDPEIGDTE